MLPLSPPEKRDRIHAARENNGCERGRGSAVRYLRVLDEGVMQYRCTAGGADGSVDRVVAARELKDTRTQEAAPMELPIHATLTPTPLA